MNESEIIVKIFENKQIFFDKKENQLLYLNATKTAQQFKKEAKEWKRLPSTIQYMEALTKAGFSHDGDLIITKRGGSDKSLMGIWIHKKLVIMFARWLSADFSVWCDLQIEEILQSETSQPTQTSQDFDIKSYTQQNRDLIELIELINSKNAITLHYLDKLTKTLNLKSPLDLLQIDLNSYYFIPTELGKFFNKSAVEINKILEAKGFQFKENGVWQLTDSGKKYAIQLDNNFSTIKWKLESLI
jgi:hypothetical protein